MRTALTRHWPEYLMEAALLGLFMVSACVFVILVEHPATPIRQTVDDPLARRLLVGLAMGMTAIALIYSPWGQQSGAHMNPAVTLTFLRLGKVEPWDAVFYAAAQFAGAVAGVALCTAAAGGALADPTVNFVATSPGTQGAAVAFAAEVAISFLLMSTVLVATNRHRVARFTGLFAGTLVALYITFEAPLSGMSMNPARTFGSAVSAQLWTALWVYFTAPPLGMLLAAELYTRVKGIAAVKCCKLNHQNDKRCIFRCGYRYEHNRSTAQQTAVTAPARGPSRLSQHHSA